MRYESFNYLLRNKVKSKWGQQCQNSFKWIMQYLLNSSILRPPTLRKPHLLYITVNDHLWSFVPQYKERSHIEYTIYYISKTFVQHEKNYSHMKKACLTLVYMFQKLRPYFLSNEAKIFSKLNILKYILDQPFLTRWIANWQVTLV